MKQFLYLDTDIVNSIIAQTQNGLEQSVKTENDETVTESSSNNEALNVTVDGKGNAFGLLKIGGGVTLNSEDVDGKLLSNTSHEITEKILHDAAFNMALQSIERLIIKDDDIISGKVSLDYGSYFCINRVFSFVDLQYLDELFHDEDVKQIVFSSTDGIDESHSEQISKGLNRSQRRKIAREQVKKESSYTEVTDTDDNVDVEYSAKVISAIRKIAPYDKFLVSEDGLMIPLNNKYFRVDAKDMGFRYGGHLYCVGMVTNIIGNGINDDNIFTNMQKSINEAFQTLLPTNQDMIYVCHPIAVYYDNRIIEAEGN